MKIKTFWTTLCSILQIAGAFFIFSFHFRFFWVNLKQFFLAAYAGSCKLHS